MNRNAWKRRLAMSGSVALIGASAVVLAPVSPAHATPEDCDGEGVVGIFERVGSGASFTYRGRAVELQNESALDTYSRAEITSGWQSGDQVWVDRSYRRFSVRTSGIVSDATAESEGWKQCGPFSRRTQSVINSVFAARACARIEGTTKCGRWYVD